MTSVDLLSIFKIKILSFIFFQKTKNLCLAYVFQRLSSLVTGKQLKIFLDVNTSLLFNRQAELIRTFLHKGIIQSFRLKQGFANLQVLLFSYIKSSYKMSFFISFNYFFI